MVRGTETGLPSERTGLFHGTPAVSPAENRYLGVLPRIATRMSNVVTAHQTGRRPCSPSGLTYTILIYLFIFFFAFLSRSTGDSLIAKCTQEIFPNIYGFPHSNQSSNKFCNCTLHLYKFKILPPPYAMSDAHEKDKNQFMDRETSAEEASCRSLQNDGT